MELRLATHKQFGAFSLDLDLVIQEEACGIFGPSGSGCSTASSAAPRSTAASTWKAWSGCCSSSLCSTGA